MQNWNYLYFNSNKKKEYQMKYMIKKIDKGVGIEWYLFDKTIPENFDSELWEGTYIV